MGKTPKPLHFAVDPVIADWPEWDALRAQGHTVTVLEVTWDVHLGPSAWQMHALLKPMLAQAIRSYRAKRYTGKRERSVNGRAVGVV